jgi:hypothetical protein
MSYQRVHEIRDVDHDQHHCDAQAQTFVLNCGVCRAGDSALSYVEQCGDHQCDNAEEQQTREPAGSCAIEFLLRPSPRSNDDRKTEPEKAVSDYGTSNLRLHYARMTTI